MSKKKTIACDSADLSVTVPGTHTQRRVAELSGAQVELVKYKQRRQANPNDTKVDVARHKQRTEGQISDVIKCKKKQEPELSNVRVDMVKDKKRREAEPSDVRVDVGRHKQQRNKLAEVCGGTRSVSKISSKPNDFVYVNKAYVGSQNSVNEVRTQAPPITGVYREQYWTCSKWSLAKKVLAISVGVLLGAGIGLGIILAVTGKEAEDVIGGIFQPSAPG